MTEDQKTEDPALAEQRTLREDRIEVAKLEKLMGQVNAALMALTNRGVVVEVDCQSLTYMTLQEGARTYPQIVYRALRAVEPI